MIDLDTIRTGYALEPGETALSLEERAAEVFGVPQENVLIGDSSLALLRQIVGTIDGTIGIVPPDYFEFREMCSKVSYIKELAKPPEGLSAILLSNPNNPTGELRDLSPLLAWAKDTGSFLIVDEAYMEWTGEERSLLPYVTDGNTVVLRTMSKFYGMTQDKVGYLFGPEELLRGIRPNAPCAETKKKAVALLGHPDLGKAREDMRTRKAVLTALLGELDAYALPGETNFLFARAEEGKLADTLRELGVRVLDLDSAKGIEGRGYCRIAVPGWETLEELSARLDAYIDGR